MSILGFIPFQLYYSHDYSFRIYRIAPHYERLPEAARGPSSLLVFFTGKEQIYSQTIIHIPIESSTIRLSQLN